MSDMKNTTSNQGQAGAQANPNGPLNPGVSGTDGATFDVSAEIQKMQEQAEKFKNDYLYLRAEFENYKKHAVKERSDLVKYGAERMARDLLGVLDNFERALSTSVTADNVQIFRQGVEMTANELRSMLGRHGISEVPSEGVSFDPSVHEALSSEATDSVQPGFISRVFAKAYRLHDKLIRPAQVVVARKPE